MKTKRILVLSGIKYNLESTMKSAASLAKIIDAKVDFFYVKKPTEIVDKESQLSAIRRINREQIEMQNKLNNLLQPYAKKYDIKIKSKFSVGNVKNEIQDYLSKVNPDIVILGKKSTNLFKLKDDGITDFILSRFEGPVLIAPSTNHLEPETELSIGLLNNLDKDISSMALEELASKSANPLKTFTIISQSNKDKAIEPVNYNTHTEFVFEKTSNVLSSVSNYIDKSKVNLLCLERNKQNKSDKSQFLSPREIINKTNVPLLFGGKKGFGLS